MLHDSLMASTRAQVLYTGQKFPIGKNAPYENRSLRVRWYEMRMRLQARQDPCVMLLRTIPGVGPVTASAIVATAGDASQFKNASSAHPLTAP